MDFLKKNNRELTNLERDILQAFNVEIDGLAQSPETTLVSEPKPSEDFISTTLLAKEFGYDPIHIARIARQGKVESTKNDGQWFVSRSSLQDYKIKAEANRRAVSLASIKVSNKKSFEKFYLDFVKDVSVIWASYKSRQEESSRRRQEFVSKFFSPTKEALNEINSNFDKDIAGIAEYKLPTVNVSAILNDYLARQNASSRRREEWMSKFFSPTGEAIIDINSKFSKSAARLVNFGLSIANEVPVKVSLIELSISNFLRRLVPSIVLFQIAERIRANKVGLRSPRFDGFKPILFALFILLFGATFGLNSLDGQNLNRDSSSASIFSTLGNKFFNFVVPAKNITKSQNQPQDQNNSLVNRVTKLEKEINSIQYSLSGVPQNKLITQIIERQVLQPNAITFPSLGASGDRLASLEALALLTVDKFNAIDERFRITPTLWIQPTGFVSSGISAPSITSTDTVSARTLTVSGGGSITGGLSVGGPFSAGQYSGAGLSDCDASNQTLNWDDTTGQFSCGSDDSGSGGTSGPQLGVEIIDSGSTFGTHYGSISFDAGGFTTSFTGSASFVKIDYANGPASRSANESITGLWRFTAASNQFSNALEIGTTASIGGNLFVKGTASISSNFEVGTNLFVIRSTGTSTSLAFENTSYSSSSQLFGSGLQTCNATTGKLTWSSGTFSCATDTSVASFGGIEVAAGVGSLGTHYGSISFDANMFSATAGAGTQASVSFIRLNWTSGPASRSIEQTIISQWEFRNGASFSSDLEVSDNSGLKFAVFSSASLGRFGLGDTTPEAYFEIASSSGIVASISNAFYVDGKNQRIGIGTSAPTGPLFLLDNLVGATSSGSFAIRSLNTVGTVASISGMSLTTGDLLKLSVLSGYTGRAFRIADTAGLTLASISGRGKLELAGGASFSNSAMLGTLGHSVLNILASTSYSRSHNGDISTQLLTGGVTTGNVVSISAGTLTSGNVFKIVVPASSSTNIGSVFSVKTTSGSYIASLSFGGQLQLRGRIYARGTDINCVGMASPNGPCLDYAESYQTHDLSLASGEIVAIDSSTPSYVARASKARNAIGVVSTKPAALINGSSFLAGDGAIEKRPGYIAVALAGRVPVKVSTENGNIKSGDYLTVSQTRPGVAMRATKAGNTIGIALEDYSNKEGGTVTVFVNTGFYNGTNLEELVPGIEGTSFTKALISQFNKNPAGNNFSDILTDRVAAGLEIITPKISASGLAADTVRSLSGSGVTISLAQNENLVINKTNNSGSNGQSAVIIDSLGNAFFAGKVTANEISAKVSGMDLAYFGEDANFLKNLKIGGNLTVSGSASFEKTITTSKLITNQIDSPTITGINDLIALLASRSDSLDKRLNIIENKEGLNLNELMSLKGGLEVTGGAIINGVLKVDEIGSVGDFISFISDTVYFGRPYFNSDTGGFATIYKGQDRVDVVFDKEYLETPVVNVTMRFNSGNSSSDYINTISSGGISYIVDQKDNNGFSIILSKPAPADINFNWLSIAIKNPKTFFSIKSADPIEETSIDTPTPTPDDTSVNVTPPPTLEPTPSATPEITPSLEPAPEPEPSLAPEIIEEPPVFEPTQ